MTLPLPPFNPPFYCLHPILHRLYHILDTRCPCWLDADQYERLGWFLKEVECEIEKSKSESS